MGAVQARESVRQDPGNPGQQIPLGKYHNKQR
jgi:hypothetical protein